MKYIDDTTYTNKDVSEVLLKQFLKTYDRWERRQENRNLNYLPDYEALANAMYTTYKQAKYYGF